jgi:molecular chaperone DnaK (HSP70)
MTRTKLEGLVSDLIERTEGPCRQALEDAEITAAGIDDVILVGGQTRMPKVQERVKDIVGKDLRKDVKPDEARKFHELVEARYRADALIHSTRTTVAEFADKLDAAAKARIERLIAALEEAMKGNDAQPIAVKTEALGTETGKAFEAARAAAAPGGGAQAPGGGDDDVVDAELEDVSDDRESD